MSKCMSAGMNQSEHISILRTQVRPVLCHNSMQKTDVKMVYISIINVSNNSVSTPKAPVYPLLLSFQSYIFLHL